MTYRDQLSPGMRDSRVFEYYEVRPAIRHGDQAESFVRERDFEVAKIRLTEDSRPFQAFWTLYGRYEDGDGAMLAQAIGDFNSKDAAHEIMNAILGIPAAVNATLESAWGEPVSTVGELVSEAGNWLADMINQSSNTERI